MMALEVVMNYKLSNKLSPRAKKAMLMAGEGQRLSCLLQVSPSRNVQKLRRELEEMGGSIKSWTEETHLMSVEMDASHLSDMADLEGVVYIETGERCAP
jgi:hypothetical protein